MTAQPVLMDEKSIPEQETFDTLWTHLPYGDGRICVRGLRYRFRMQKDLPFNPDNAFEDILLEDPQQRLFWGHVQTMNFLQWYFNKNKKTGENAGGVYAIVGDVLTIPRLEASAIEKMLEILLKEVDIAELHNRNVLKRIDEENPHPEVPYKKDVKGYKERYRGHRLEISGEHPNYVEANVILKNGEKYAATLVPLRYVKTEFERHKREGKTTIEHETGRIISPYGLCFPHTIILVELTEENTRKTIGDLIERLSVEKAFRAV